MWGEQAGQTAHDTPQPAHLDSVVVVNKQVGGFEVAVNDGGPVAVERQHAARRIQRLGECVGGGPEGGR